MKPEKAEQYPAADPLVDALAQARAEFGAVVKDSTATVQTKAGGKYQYRYAMISDYLDACVPALSKHGLVLAQRTEIREGALVLLTDIRHRAGGVLPCGEYPVALLPAEPQALGSAMTYARRYALSCALGMAAEDDDGEAAGRAPAPKAEPEKPGAPLITTEQRKALISAVAEAGLKPEQARAIMHEVGGVPDSRSLPAHLYGAVLAAIGKAKAPEREPGSDDGAAA